MSIKVVAIGNYLMGNDMIGLRILEKIAYRFKPNNIETFIGETDFEYCLSILQNHDFVFVIDAAILGCKLGEITVMPFEIHASLLSTSQTDTPSTNALSSKGYTQHLLSLFDFTHLYFKDLKGYIIGIEVQSIACNLNLSEELELLLDDISLKVYHQIMELVSL